MDTGEWFRWAAAFVLGALSTILIEFGRGQLERRQRLQDRRDDFQRETLIELQGVLETINLAVSSQQALTEMDDETYADVEDMVPGEHVWAEQEARAAIRLHTLVVRVKDDEARRLVADFAKLLPDLIPDMPVPESAALVEKVAVASLAAHDRIGQLVRGL